LISDTAASIALAALVTLGIGIVAVSRPAESDPTPGGSFV